MLDIASIRHLATRHGFQEVQFNDTSRVIAFEKEGPGPRCRVNVYFNTGTVATCLDHPRSGKTQLFRRGQSLNDLDALFENPRQHTGVGYYRSKGRENWQPVDGQGRGARTFRKTECDDARRWRYIQLTQEGFCNERQADQIAALCKLFHELRFAPQNGYDIVTVAERFDSYSATVRASLDQFCCEVGRPNRFQFCRDCEQGGCKCSERTGAWCCLMTVVLKVARDMDGVLGTWNLPSWTSKEDNEEKRCDISGLDKHMNCDCTDGKIFRQRHSTFLEKLERQLRSFPPHIRRELIHWLVSKMTDGYEPFVIRSAFDPELEPSANNFPYESYGGKFCSNEIYAAHQDYGKMAYENEFKGCICHGF